MPIFLAALFDSYVSNQPFHYKLELCSTTKKGQTQLSDFRSRTIAIDDCALLLSSRTLCWLCIACKSQAATPFPISKCLIEKKAPFNEVH